METSSGVESLHPHWELSPDVRRIVDHLCEGDHPSFGNVLEWCEARGDCCHAVICPDCGVQFVIDDDEMAELRRWTAEQGEARACGVHWT
jgi:hypothetical protein